MVMSTSKTSICPSCASPGLYHSTYKATHPVFTNKSLHYCSRCGLYYVVDMPSPDELFDYNKSYWSNAHSYTTTSSFNNPWFALLASLRYQYLSHHIGMDNLSILEIGPGEGYLANHILSLHPSVRYDVLESDTFTHASLQCVCDCVYETLLSIPSSKKYDLIIVSHVLEHVPNPVDFLDSLSSLAVNNSFLFIEVPCLDFIYKTTYDPHLLFFDKPSLSYLLNQSSLELLDLSYAGMQLANLPSSAFRTFVFSLIRKFLHYIPFVFKLLPNIEPLHQISSLDQQLLSFQFSCHHLSVQPSCWLRSISTFSSK